MAAFPETDCESSGYTAGLVYDGGHRIVLPGLHATYMTARQRALAARDALRQVGEVGLSAHINFFGERPEGFPRNGLRV